MSKLDKKRRRHKLRQKKNSFAMKKVKAKDKVKDKIAKQEAEEEAKPKMSDKKGVAHSKKSNDSTPQVDGIDRSVWGLKDE